MPRTTVFGWFDGTCSAGWNASGTCRAARAVRQRYWRILARHAVLAAGANERPMVFRGNDRPGVMQAGAVRA